jgi:alpha-galactosidase
MISPVHIKSGGNLEKMVQKNISLDSEMEYYIVGGDVLAYRGISLNQQFGGTGYDKETRVIGDFGSRLYYIQAMK